ncbi:SAM-dependent methyltransferase [Rhabdochlamydiaceae symbiont of Dictyostelium giganteum]|uniref:SAM-dependent methyltransferase n=1 Tax=Rhabdochlamydiaceae symbiont of Dictyostelium giganteum TaxID=3342349 RepID=UPI0038515774
MKKLYLLPNILHEESPWRYTPPSIDALIAESHKGGYLFLKKFALPSVPIYLLNEHTKDIEELLALTENTVGLISDAGLPCLADPGSVMVERAFKKGIEVEAIPGPSSITMALQLSGFSGQLFTFHGYFPREEHDIAKLPKTLHPLYTHLFIETPYKLEKTFQKLLKFFPSTVKIGVALELMSPSSFVEVHSVAEWKKKSLPYPKARGVILIHFTK